MKNILISLTKQFIFWILFFALLRFVFFVYHANMLIMQKIDFLSIVASFWYALQLDISSTCYILLIPFVLLLFQSFYSPKWLNVVNKVYTVVIIIIYSLITCGELGIYAEWKTKLHYKGLTYLRNPSEVYNSSSTFLFFLILGIFLVLTFVSYYFYKKHFYKGIIKVKRNTVFSIIFFFIMPPLFFLGIRGGIQEIPISVSKSYYSKHNILNLAAVNSGWNLVLSIMESIKFVDNNPFDAMDLSEAKKIVNDLHTVEKDTTISVLKNSRPNIILILLESWTADLIESLGGEPGITPVFNELEKDGILFTKHYASGNRSQHAMTSILAGFPATPITTITNHFEKYSSLPSLTKIFNDLNYSTSFYFGGQLIYGNIKSYIIYNEFDKIYEGKDFDSKLPRGKLGVHDEFIFKQHIKDMNREKEPFFSFLFTLSTHSPYDQPMEKVLDWGGNENEFINSGYYTDKSLGAYFKEARKQKWYDNTLFILVADHSHNSYRNWPLQSFEYHKIPLLLYGNVIKEEYKGTTWDKLASNTDITSTLLSQMNISHVQFPWSKDLFNPYSPDFVFFELNNGFGWKTLEGEFVYNSIIDHYYIRETPESDGEEFFKEGKAYLQVMFQEFMDF